MPDDDSRSLPGLGRVLLATTLFAVFALLIGGVWLRLLTDRPGDGDLLRIVGIAAIPALAVLLVRGRAAIVVWPLAVAAAIMLAAGEAFGIAVTEARPGDGERDFFGPVGTALDLGIRDFYSTSFPFDRISHPEMTSLVLVAIFGFTAIGGMLIAARRLILAAIVLLVGVGWPATLIASVDDSTLAIGAILLVVILAVLFLARSGRRPSTGIVQAAVLGSVLVVAGVGLSTSSAVAKESALDWRAWNPYKKAPHQVGVRYVWNTSYAGINWPDEETVVLQVSGPVSNQYWRATTLDDYTGIGWVESLRTGERTTSTRLDLDDDPLLPDAASDEANWLRQDVTVAGLADNHLISSGQPVRWQLAEKTPVRQASGGVVLLPDGLAPGQRYTVWSYAPDVSPDDLINLEPRYPFAASRYLEILPDVPLPPFGADDRERRVAEIFDRTDDDVVGLIGRQHRDLYAQAQEVVGSAPTPYAVTVALEQWFRNSGGFTYNELPAPPSGSEPPLVEFVLQGREGYCQHYAGAMALMLRMLGVPARVAAGFVSGDLDEKTGVWTVTDRDAHTWVEVWFPGFGWLPFDPTPGRGSLGEAYTVSSEAFDLSADGSGATAGAVLAENADLAEIFAAGLSGLPQLGVGTATGEGVATGNPATGGEGGGFPSWAGVVLVVAGLLALLVVLKLSLRHLWLRARGPRRVSAALRRDLVGFVADQGLVSESSLTLQEIGQRVAGRYAVDTGRFVDAASAARFGPPEEAADAGRRARDAHRALIGAVRRELGLAARVRGTFRLRSLLGTGSASAGVADRLRRRPDVATSKLGPEQPRHLG